MVCGYSKKMFFTDLGSILIAASITFLLRITLLLDDPLLSNFFHFMLYIMDLSMLLAIEVTMDMKDGFVVFHCFRIIILVFAETFSQIDMVLWPSIGLIVFRICGQLINQWVGLSKIDPKSNHVKEEWKQWQGKRRKYFCCMLSIVAFLIVYLETFHLMNPLVPILTIVFTLVIIYQLNQIDALENQDSRTLSNTLHLNAFIYIIICSISGLLFHSSFYIYYQECVMFLSVGIILLRITIGSHSWKYHKSDRQLFQAFYSFSSEIVSKRYKGDRRQRGVKSMDRVSRQLSLVVYLISCVITSQGGKWYWLAIGLFFYLNFKIENSQENPFFIIQSKIKIKIRSQIIAPFLLFAWASYNRQLCQKGQLYEVVTGCSTYIDIQFWFCIIIVVLTWLVQFVRDRNHRLQMFKGIAFLSPLIVMIMVKALECQNIQLLLMTLYGLSFQIVVVWDERLAALKGGKKE